MTEAEWLECVEPEKMLLAEQTNPRGVTGGVTEALQGPVVARFMEQNQGDDGNCAAHAEVGIDRHTGQNRDTCARERARLDVKVPRRRCHC